MGTLSGWPYVLFKARIDFIRFLTGIGYERAIEYPWVFRELDLKKNHKLIDIGSATSVFPLFIKKTTGAIVHCVDFDPNVLRLKGYAEKCGLTHFLEDGSLAIQQITELPLPYPDNTFDCVSCISTIEHSPQGTDTDNIKELFRITKKGGKLVFSVPISKRHRDVFVNTHVYNRKFSGGIPEFYECQYDKESIYKRLITPSGGKLLKLECFGEPDFEFGRKIAYRKFIGLEGVLQPLRWLMPMFAHRFIKPVSFDHSPPRSFCCFVLEKS